MAFSTFLAILGILLYVYAVFSPSWAIIDFVNTDHEQVHVVLGVWGEWRSTNSSRRPAEWISHFPEPQGDRFHRLAGVYLKHYYRAQAAFCVIAISLMVFTNGMALYSFAHHRYMFKRLVAFLYLFVAMLIVLTIEVLIISVYEWNVEVAHRSQEEDWDYSAAMVRGNAVFLSWLVVVVNALAAVAYAYGSGKQKGNRAATAEDEFEDRPVHIGR